MTVTVGPATVADAAELAAVAAATFPLACPASVDPADIAAFIDENLSEQRFGGYLADPQRRVLAARAGDTGIVGYAMAVLGIGSDPAVAAAVRLRPAVELSKMYVLAGQHGTGASAALMDAALAWAAESGAACVWLGVNRNNERAQRFYRKQGFVVSGERTFTLGAGVQSDFVMTRPVGGMRFTLLDGGPAAGPIDDDGLCALYEYPDTGRPVLRANMIASIDGSASTGGLSGGLGGPGDRQVFAVLREQADVIVVGAGTARSENYGGARMSAAQRGRRRRRGQTEVPAVALVTRSGMLERDLPVLTGSEVPALVLTCTAAAPGVQDRLGASAVVLDCSNTDPGQVDLAVALRLLAGRGLTRVLTEGGPSLLGSFIDQDLLDEMCLTTAPLLVGGRADRVAVGSVEVSTPMRRAHLLTDDDGYLYSRYISVR